MTTRPTGVAPSLFDRRYRYDYIFLVAGPATLRAYDILDQDRPVVIKRPAHRERRLCALGGK